MGKCCTKHFPTPLFIGAGKPWKIRVIAAREADFSQSQQDELVWLLKVEYQRQCG